MVWRNPETRHACAKTVHLVPCMHVHIHAQICMHRCVLCTYQAGFDAQSLRRHACAWILKAYNTCIYIYIHIHMHACTDMYLPGGIPCPDPETTCLCKGCSTCIYKTESKFLTICNAYMLTISDYIWLYATEYIQLSQSFWLYLTVCNWVYTTESKFLTIYNACKPRSAGQTAYFVNANCEFSECKLRIQWTQ